METKDQVYNYYYKFEQMDDNCMFRGLEEKKFELLQSNFNYLSSNLDNVEKDKNVNTKIECNSNSLSYKSVNECNSKGQIESEKLTISSNSEDHIPGVTFDKKNQRWGARWSASDGRRAGKYFPVSQFGYDLAKKLAIECRQEAIKTSGHVNRRSQKLNSQCKPIETCVLRHSDSVLLNKSARTSMKKSLRLVNEQKEKDQLKKGEEKQSKSVQLQEAKCEVKNVHEIVPKDLESWFDFSSVEEELLGDPFRYNNNYGNTIWLLGSNSTYDYRRNQGYLGLGETYQEYNNGDDFDAFLMRDYFETSSQVLGPPLFISTEYDEFKYMKSLNISENLENPD